MTHDPADPRLVDNAATDFESSLLKAAIEEAPAPDLSAKMMAPLAAGAAAGTAAGGSKILQSAVAKWLGAGASVLVAGGAYYLGTAPEVASTNSAPPPSMPVVDTPPESTSDDASEILPDAETQSPEGLPAKPKAPPAQATPTTTPHQKKKSVSTLSEEMRLLDSARSALKSRSAPEEALRILSLYERKYPRGALRQEAIVLRVSALKESGAKDRADALTSEFLKENPKSAHKKQLESGSSLPK